MATMNATLRLVLQHASDTGEAPEKTLDTDGIDRVGLALRDYEDVMPGRRIRLAAAADDQAVTFTNAVGLVIVSHDYPFKLRLAAGETLMENLRAFVVWADDADDGIVQTSCLLTGNGTYAADLEVWIIEAAP